jgi:DNA-binding transcriptional MocR family regulator
LSSAGLARELEVSLDTVREYISLLKIKGLLVSEGAKRSGFWRITDGRLGHAIETEGGAIMKHFFLQNLTNQLLTEMLSSF